MRMGTWQMFFRGLRRLSVGVAIAGSLSGCTVAFDRIALPVDTQIAEVGVGVQVASLSEGWSFVRVAPVWWDDDRILLANVSGVTASRANGGVTLSGLTIADSGWGLSVGALADVNGDHTGVRVGALTFGGRQVGAQIGLVNGCSEDSYAVQLGLLNWNGRFWMPLMNVATGTAPEANP